MSKYVKQSTPGTTAIATTSTSDEYIVAGKTGKVVAATFTPLVALAAHDTNFITFSITNLGQAGAGTTALLAATAANTTKITGGSALAISTKRSLTLHGTAANLAVVEGDCLLLRAAADGTLANTVTRPVWQISIKTAQR